MIRMKSANDGLPVIDRLGLLHYSSEPELTYTS